MYVQLTIKLQNDNSQITQIIYWSEKTHNLGEKGF